MFNFDEWINCTFMQTQNKNAPDLMFDVYLLLVLVFV